jgi:hypothetical protein
MHERTQALKARPMNGCTVLAMLRRLIILALFLSAQALVILT